MDYTPESPEVLDLFFSPRSVAIVGLSRVAITSPVSVLTTLTDFGYTGKVFIINPNMEKVAEDGIFPNLDDVPEAIDLAVVIVARDYVLDVLSACVRNNIRAAIVITQGFADADEEGKRLQTELIGLVRDNDIRVMGPNTIGVSNAFANFTSSFIEVHKESSPIGIVSQSGLFLMGYNLINNEPAGFSMAADLGNSADINIIDILNYYAQREEIRVIQCHMEGIEHGSAFVEIAARISQNKPIIMLKAGRSKQGQVAVASHSGAAAGEHEVYQAALHRAGIITAENAEELRLLSKAFAIYPPPKGRRVAIMSYSGGGAILAIDALENAGLELAQFADSTKTKIADLFPDWISTDNPLDVWIPVARDLQTAFPRMLEAILDDDGVDAVICIYCSYTLPKYEAYDCTNHITSLASEYPDKPIACWSYGIDIAGFTEAIEKDGTTMVFPSLENAATTFAKLIQYRENKNRLSIRHTAPAKVINSFAIGSVISQAQPGPDGYLFTDALEILQTCGLAVTPWRLAANEEELVEVAANLTYPLCLKVVSSTIVHKSDSGGIKLGIDDQQGLIEAYRGLHSDIAQYDPLAKIDGVMVQEMASKGKEVMIGGKRDPVFGPCLILGTGGIYTEIFHDYVFRLAPVNETEAEEMIAELRLAPLLTGVRGEASCHIPSIVDALVKVSHLLAQFEEIIELDVNPLIVDGQGAVVVDARIFLENVQ
jgi:acyl-CoA synthetase (NDP forming)